MASDRLVPLVYERTRPDEMKRRGKAWYEQLDQRRSVRQFSADPVPRQLIELAIRSASTAPSGAHRQPWHFAAVSDAGVKREIRIAAEREEYASYQHRMPDEWLEAVHPLGTTWEKPFLETAPWLVIAFEQTCLPTTDSRPAKNYYVKESVGIACGLFITAVHEMGLVTLTHTPSPMAFLSSILSRPAHERPFLLFPVGYPAPGATVPRLQRKPLDEISSWHV